MLNVKISVNDTGPINLPDLRPVLDDIAADWRSETISRTRAGKDASGKAMRRKSDGSVSRLHDSGQMLRSLQADVGDRGFTIAPSGARNRTSSLAISSRAPGRQMGMGADEQTDRRDARDRRRRRTSRGSTMTEQRRNSRSAPAEHPTATQRAIARHRDDLTRRDPADGVWTGSRRRTPTLETTDTGRRSWPSPSRRQGRNARHDCARHAGTRADPAPRKGNARRFPAGQIAGQVAGRRARRVHVGLRSRRRRSGRLIRE